MNHGEGFDPNVEKEELALRTRGELSILFNNEGKIVYKPELFSDAFNKFYGIYQRAAAREEGLRTVNGGKTVDYTQADYARRDAHIAAADQLVEDLGNKGVKLSSYEAETIIKKMLAETNPGNEELPLLRRAFILDAIEHPEDDE